MQYSPEGTDTDRESSAVCIEPWPSSSRFVFTLLSASNKKSLGLKN